CVVFTRPEAAIPGVVALGVWAADGLVGQRRWRAGTSWLYSSVQGPLAFLSRHPVLIALFCFGGWFVSCQSGCGNNQLRSALAGLYPFNTQFLLAFVLLPVLGLPVAVAMAALAGGAYAAMHFRRF